MLVKHMVID